MEIEEMKVERLRMLNEMTQLSGWVTGSLVKTERAQQGKKSPFCYLSRSVNGKNRITYVAARDFEVVAEVLETGKRARRLFEQIAELTIAIIKAERKQVEGKRR